MLSICLFGVCVWNDVARPNFKYNFDFFNINTIPSFDKKKIFSYIFKFESALITKAKLLIKQDFCSLASIELTISVFDI